MATRPSTKMRGLCLRCESQRGRRASCPLSRRDRNPNVKALVYIAAFAPDQGETSGTLANMFPGTGLTQANLVFRPYPLTG
jgi:hypothetical protein